MSPPFFCICSQQQSKINKKKLAAIGKGVTSHMKQGRGKPPRVTDRGKPGEAQGAVDDGCLCYQDGRAGEDCSEPAARVRSES